MSPARRHFEIVSILYDEQLENYCRILVNNATRIMRD